MDYLTNYYKNLCEQLQEKLNVLEAQLNEFNYGPGGIKMPPTSKSVLSDKQKQQFRDFALGPRRNPKDPDAPPVGREGEEGYWEEPIQLIGGSKQEARWVRGKRKPAIDKMTGKEIGLFGNNKPSSQTSAQTSGETDDDIYAMRQTAADQGGIPQSMVNEPINRTKQMPDGTLIYGQTPTRLQMKPKPGLQVKPNMPLPAPKDETMIPVSLKGLRDEISFNKKEYGLIPPPRKDLRS
jgi:hypothetical protein